MAIWPMNKCMQEVQDVGSLPSIDLSCDLNCARFASARACLDELIVAQTITCIVGLSKGLHFVIMFSQ